MRPQATATASSSGGIGFAGLLTIVFIVLKLTDVIDWSWWWVLSPIWISALLVLVVFIIVLGIILFDDHTKEKQRSLKQRQKPLSGYNPEGKVTKPLRYGEDMDKRRW